MRGPKKLKEFPLIVFDPYAASDCLYPSPTGYPVQVNLSVLGYVSNRRGIRFGRVRLRYLLPVVRALVAGDNFCAVSGSEYYDAYRLEVWKHGFNM